MSLNLKFNVYSENGSVKEQELPKAHSISSVLTAGPELFMSIPIDLRSNFAQLTAKHGKVLCISTDLTSSLQQPTRTIRLAGKNNTFLAPVDQLDLVRPHVVTRPLKLAHTA